MTREPGRVRELIGLTGQLAAVDEALTGRENLLLVTALLEVASAPPLRRPVAPLFLTLIGGTR